ncbi:50S ribosomal protein L21 [Candidatus Berkelbacteria bacterium]|nr:50S ribosomal protein L21 [Candidatus Berkelbacteria bacterium]
MSTKTVAVIQTGGKQYLVAPGETVRVELLPGESGDVLELEDILGGVTVKATIVEHGQGKKVWGKIFQSKSRHSRYPRGHRQRYTLLAIESVTPASTSPRVTKTRKAGK